jgi:DNA sulfur modification protein DndB
MLFQTFINNKFKDYAPTELVDWQERQDKDLQTEGREYGESVEKHIKHVVIDKLKELFNENWDIEIGKIQRECDKRAKEEMERQYKEGLGRQEISWTEMFFITDYKEIIKKYWSTTPNPIPGGFIKFEEEFSIDVGLGYNSKDDKIKWLSRFSSLRNLWAHAGTKEKGLNKEEVSFLKKIHQFFFV